eukprot:3403594-Pleurochrysis_carterae.AAC.2
MLASSHMPFEETAPANEGQRCTVSVGVRRQERVTHRRCAADAGESDVDELVVCAAGGERDVANRYAGTRFAVYPGERVIARSHVDKIAYVGMYVVWASAVDHEADVTPVRVQAAGVSFAARGCAAIRRSTGVRSTAGRPGCIASGCAVRFTGGRPEQLSVQVGGGRCSVERVAGDRARLDSLASRVVVETAAVCTSQSGSQVRAESNRSASMRYVSKKRRFVAFRQA